MHLALIYFSPRNGAGLWLMPATREATTGLENSDTADQCPAGSVWPTAQLGGARDMQLLENVHFGWGKRHILCGLLAIAFVFGASAQSQNRQLESLIHEGQSALDAGEFARAVSNFE